MISMGLHHISTSPGLVIMHITKPPKRKSQLQFYSRDSKNHIVYKYIMSSKNTFYTGNHLTKARIENDTEDGIKNPLNQKHVTGTEKVI